MKITSFSRLTCLSIIFLNLSLFCSDKDSSRDSRLKGVSARNSMSSLFGDARSVQMRSLDDKVPSSPVEVKQLAGIGKADQIASSAAAGFADLEEAAMLVSKDDIGLDLTIIEEDLLSQAPVAVGRTWTQSFTEAWFGKAIAVKKEIDQSFFDVRNRANAGNRLNWALLDNVNEEKRAVQKALLDQQRTLDELTRVRSHHLSYTSAFSHCALANKLEINAAGDLYKHIRAAKYVAMIQLHKQLSEAAEYLKHLKEEEERIKLIGRIERPSSPSESYDSLETLVTRSRAYALAEEAKKKREAGE